MRGVLPSSYSLHSRIHTSHPLQPGVALGFWARPPNLGTPLPLPLPPPWCLGREGPWAFPSSLACLLDTSAAFPGPAPFIRGTMSAHSEGLVWHPGPEPFDLRNFSSADLSP